MPNKLLMLPCKTNEKSLRHRILQNRIQLFRGVQMTCWPLRKDQLTNSKAVCQPISEAWKKILLDKISKKMSDNQSRIFSGNDQQALEGGDFEPFRRQFDSSLYSGGKVSQFNIGSILFLKSCLDTHTVVPSDNIRGGSISTTQYSTIPQASLHQKKSLWLSH